MDKNDYYGGESTSFNLTQVLFIICPLQERSGDVHVCLSVQLQPDRSKSWLNGHGLFEDGDTARGHSPAGRAYAMQNFGGVAESSSYSSGHPVIIPGRQWAEYASDLPGMLCSYGRSTGLGRRFPKSSGPTGTGTSTLFPSSSLRMASLCMRSCTLVSHGTWTSKPWKVRTS